jgi:hypothetical protein
MSLATLFILAFSLVSGAVIQRDAVKTLGSRNLNPTCAPGGNFNFSHWELQLPIGNPGSPETISSAQLEGCSGYEESDYFYTDSTDGTMVMIVPGNPSTSGCVTTPNSNYCRTELREEDPTSWDPKAATNRLSATVSVIKADNSTYGTIIGQIHMATSVSTYPVAKLYCSHAGALSVGVHKSISGGTEYHTSFGTIPLGASFTYELIYERGVLSVSINGKAAKTVSLGSLGSPLSYFKAGNYNQGGTPSEVHFSAVSIVH